MSNPFDQFDTFSAPAAPARRGGGIDVDAIARGARDLGIDPVDLATAISYETGGTFDPDQWGPTTKWGRHRGLIQFGEPQRAQYGVRPGMTVAEQMPAVVAYLRDAGVQPGMGMLDVYSAINAGGVGRYNASDAAAGGAPGTVADKVNQQMGDHRRRAQQLLGGIGGGGGGGGSGAMPANPFDQFDNLPAAPNFGNVQSGSRSTEVPNFASVQTAFNSTEGLRGLPALPGEVLKSGNGDIPARPEDREVGRIYTDKRGMPRRWMGDSWSAGDSARETTLAEMAGGAGVDLVQGLTRAPESLLDLIGWATGGESLLTPEGKAAFEDTRQTLEQFKPEAYRAEQAVPVVQRDAQGGVAGFNLPTGEKVGGVIAQSLGVLPQMVYGGGGLKTAAQGILPNAPKLASVLGYGTANAGMVAPGIAEQARTEALAAGATPEEAQDVANKAMAMAVPLTAATGGIGEGLAGVQGAGAKSLVSALLRGALTEAPTESIEEAGTSAIGDIAQGRDVNQANALESGIMAAFGGGIPGATVAGTEYVANRNRPAALPADPATMQDIVAQAQALAPIVSAEAAGAGAVPRQGEAPAAPPPSAQLAAPRRAPTATEAPAPAPEVAPAASEGPRAETQRQLNQSPRRPRDLLETIARGKGLDREAFRAMGVDPAEFTRRAGFGYIFRKNGGMTPDQLREFMQQEGYLPRDPEGLPPTVSANDAYDLFDRAFRGGQRIYSDDQSADVADYDEARREADDEYRSELSGMPEFAPSVDASPDFDPFADPAVADFSSAIADLTERAYEMGATDAEIIGASFDTSDAEDHIAALENIIQEKINAQPRPDPSAAPRDRESGREPRQEAPAAQPRAGDFQLQQPAPAEARSEAVAPQPGLFAPPTAREQVTARERAVDAERNGLGRDEVPASRGDGELFAGGRPEQARIDQKPPAPVERVLDTPARTTSIKNAVTDAERIAEGRDQIIREARKGNSETVDEAVISLRETPTLGRETAARVAAGGPVELKDEAVLLVHKVDLRKRRDAAAERAQSPTLDDEARTAARREYEDLVQQIDEVDQAAVRIGTESGRLLQLRRRMIAEDYSLPALERKLRMVVNRDLKPAERAELQEMADKVAELQRKLDAAESQQASAQVAEMLARLMQQAPGRNATLAERRAAAAESRAALSAMAAGRGGQRSVQADRGEPGQARAALADRFGRGVIRALERDGVLKFEGAAGGSWDGATIRIGDVRPENAVGVLLHEASHARLAEVLGPKAYDTALRDLDALEAAGDATALRARKRFERHEKAGFNPSESPDDERLAYLVEEAAKANRTTGGVSGKARELARRLLSAFRQWAATSPVFRALERIGAPRPTLQPEDFVGFAEASLRQLQRDAAQPEARRLRGKIGALETELRTDRLTGMRNKRAFDEDAELGWPAVVAIDMDGLKRLNDAIGHEAADNVMRAMADELRGAEGDGARFYRRSGDEFAARFRDPADAEAAMQDLQTALEDMRVQLDVADADGRVRSYTYEGIGISYGTGATYETADAAANRQKQTRLEAGLREQPRADGPSRRLREDSPRPGGRRAGDPPAVGAQRSVPDQTQTPAFKRWFGDSKVVDANGDPLVAYRGGATANWRDGSDITEFRSTNGPWAGFFTSSPETASRFATAQYAMSVRGGAPAGVFPVYLNIRKPLEVDAKGRPARDFQIDASTVEQPDSPLREKLLNGDYDGLILRNTSDEGDVFVALRPEQIKSATANRGTFDPADLNIMRSIPEGEDAAPAGADPVAFFHLARMGAFHYADGARDVAEWTRRMEADLGAAAGQYRGMLTDAFKAAQAQATRPTRGQESVAEAVEAIGDQRRPRDVKRVVRAVVAEGMRGEDQVFEAAAQALDMETDAVRALFVQPEPGPRTLSEAQAEIERLRKALRAAQRPDPETRYQDQRARDFQRRIAELEERIAAGDFEKRERVERELTKENERLRFELEKAKERFHRYAIAAEFAQRTPLGKLWGETYAGINFARAIMTALDLSAVFRQGGFITLGHPGRALKGIMPMLRAAISEQAEFDAMHGPNGILNRPNAHLYKKFGLELTGIGGDALSRTEEAFASRWVDQWSKWAGGGLIRGSGRAYTAFLNRLRADSFDAMLAALARDGSNPTKEEGKAIANYINVATGRGKVGKNEKSGEVLNTVFFAPRLVASRFQLLAGQPLYGGSNRTRKMIAMEYARFLIGVSVATGLAMLMRDEDDETKPIELDPRSANFGKLRFGDTFLDPLAGLAQVTVFLSRVLSGETRTTTTDALRPLRDQYRLTDVAPGLGDGRALGKVGYGGRDVPDVIASFLRSKLAPVPGAIINVATGENMIGEEVTPLSAAGELVTPMSVGNLVDVMEAQGMARGTAINLLGILGMSVQYRKPDAEKLAEEQNGVLGAMGVGTAEDLE